MLTLSIDSAMNLRMLTLPLFAAATVAATTGLYDHRSTAPAGTMDAGAKGRDEYMTMLLRDPATGRIPSDIRSNELAFSRTLPTREHPAYRKGAAGSIGPIGWSQRGPENYGGRTRAIAFDIDDERILLAGAASGGVWRSSDAGATWSRTSSIDGMQSVTTLAQDTRSGHTDTWYYGTGERLGISYYRGDGLFKSTDNGLSWSALSSTAVGSPERLKSAWQAVWRVATDPSNLEQEEVYAAALGAIMRSTDGGATWERALGSTDAQGGTFTDVVVSPTGVVYAAISRRNTATADAGIWRSVDGTTWHQIATPPIASNAGRVVLALAPTNPNLLYALAQLDGTAESHQLLRYTYLSGDGTGAGGSWETRQSAIPSAGSFDPRLGRGFESQGGYDLMIAVKPDDENMVVIGGTNLYRSTDGFVARDSTSLIGGYRARIDSFSIDPEANFYPAHHPDQHALVFSRTDPSVALSACDGGIFRTSNITAPTVVWTSLNNRYITTQFYSVAIDHAPNGGSVLAGGTQDQGTFLAVGPVAPMARMLGADGGFCAFAPGRSSVYGSTQMGNVYRGVLNATFQLVAYTMVTPKSDGNFLFITPLTLDPNDGKVMYMAEGTNLWRNSDLTKIPLLSLQPTTVGWKAIDVESWTQASWITAIGVSSSPANRVYVGTDRGYVIRVDNANSDAPVLRQLRTEDLPVGATVNCIAVDPQNGDRAILVFSNYGVRSLWLTADGGENWSDISGNLEQNLDGSGAGPSCRWATIVHRGAETLYLVGTSTGLYSTTELNGASTTWVKEGAATIGDAIVTMIDARQSDGFTAVATHGAGIFTGTIPSTVQGVEAISTTLYSPAPNPAATSTTVRFTLARATRVTFDLTDSRGRSRNIAGGEFARGEHAIEISLDGEPSGSYRLRMFADGSWSETQLVVSR